MGRIRIVGLLILMAAFASLPQRAGAQISEIDALTSVGASAPNILLLFDTSGSMTRCLDETKCSKNCGAFTFNKKCNIAGFAKSETAAQALVNVLDKVNPPNGVNGRIENARFGLGIYNNAGGAYILVPVGQGTTDDIIGWLDNPTSLDRMWSIGGNTHGLAQTDMARYIAYPNQFGNLPLWGTVGGGGGKHDETNPPPEAVYNAPSFLDSECRDTFMIIIADGLWSYKSQDTQDRYGTCPSGQTCFDEVVGDADGDGEIWMDDISLVMANYDFAPSVPGVQSVRTHMVGFNVDDPLLVDTATQGGGTYATVTDTATMEAALLAATKSIFDGLLTFSAATVPASRTALSNGFFNSYFHAKTDEAYWSGHLEAYRFSPSLEVLDKNGNLAVDPNSGAFLEPRAPYWDLQTQLLSAVHPPRKLYTQKGAARVSFDAATINAVDLALSAADLLLYPNDPAVPFGSTEDLADALVAYIEGQDAFDEDRDGNAVEKRDAILGDIFHSTPILIGAPGIGLSSEPGFGPLNDASSFLGQYQYRDRKLYVGANDGMLHAVNAGSFQSGDDPATTEIENGYYDFGTGYEEFGYVPGMVLDTLKFIPRNVPKTYFYVDATPSAADVWIPSNSNDTTKDASEWTTVLVSGLRQGGSGYFALDVTDPTATTGVHGPYPKLLWEIDETNLPLGETWSEPVITRVRLKAGSTDFCGHSTTDDGPCREQWVAIFGGGYRADGDPNLGTYVSDPNSATWTNRSKGIFMVAIDTGQVIGQVLFDPNAGTLLNKMRYSIPSTPAVFDLDFDGYADVVYIGDLGGQLWRWDLSQIGDDTGATNDGIMDNWPVGLFFEADPAPLVSGGTHYHSIFFPPAATYLNGNLVLAFASGERSDLEYTGAATDDDNNRIWVAWDRVPLGLDPEDPATGWVTIKEGYTTVNGVTRGLNDVTNLATDPQPDDDGYYLIVPDGEKFVNNHVIFGGVLLSVSYTPGAGGGDPCIKASGSSNLFALNLDDAGGLLDPSAAAGNAQRRAYIGPGAPSDPRISVSKDQVLLIGKTSTGSIFSLDVPSSPPLPVELVYWRTLF
ncbi:MAG: pilus assembly protein [Myxococcota bacterium]